MQESVDRSDIILFVLEYDKITTLDEAIVKMLRKSGKTVVVAANKADNADRIREAQSLLKLGFERLFPTSSVHSRGVADLRAEFARILKAEGYAYNEPEYGEDTLKIALVGRPNVGKSSIVNAMVGENRVMVRDMPGTTRDSIDTVVEHK